MHIYLLSCYIPEMHQARIHGRPMTEAIPPPNFSSLISKVHLMKEKKEKFLEKCFTFSHNFFEIQYTSSNDVAKSLPYHKS